MLEGKFPVLENRCQNYDSNDKKKKIWQIQQKTNRRQFSYFPKKIAFENNLHDMSNLIFLEKNNKSISKCHLLKFLFSMLSIKYWQYITYLLSLKCEMVLASIMPCQIYDDIIHRFDKTLFFKYPSRHTTLKQRRFNVDSMSRQ